MKNSIFLFSFMFLLCLTSCDPDTTLPPDQMSITCSPDTTVYISVPNTSTSNILLDDPVVISNCESDQYTITNTWPAKINAGTYSIRYTLQDSCGAQDSCSMNVNVILLASSISIKCPGNKTIVVAAPEIPGEAYNVYTPTVISDCQIGQYTVESDWPDVLTPGQHTITYIARDNCGHAASCSYKLTVIYDHRLNYLGRYTGTYSCSSFPNQHPYPERDTFVEVRLSPKPDFLFVGDDEVLVDSTGTFPNPSTSPYRFYGFKFRNDSLHRFQNWGSIGHQTLCYFHGKKE